MLDVAVRVDGVRGEREVVLVVDCVEEGEGEGVEVEVGRGGECWGA